MEVFRLSKKQYSTSLSGIGAAMYGARWNSKGTELVYTASNRSLAMAEVAVHFSLSTLPKDYVMMTIYVPDKLAIQQVPEEKLPIGWNSFPHPHGTKHFGDSFVLDSKFSLLRVPSAVTQGDHNILINPHHADFVKIKIVEVVPFPFDRRLFKG